ncbi:TPR domain protein [Minicystis rosea]|nr:TPR domain protein [Minicystis rosea]
MPGGSAVEPRGRRRHRRGIALAASLSLVSAAGCARPPAAPTSPLTPKARLIADARAAGIPAADPLELDAGLLRDVTRVIPDRDSAPLRLRQLLSYLNDRGYVSFQYLPGRSLTANDAAHERRGDCMAYAHLFTALARRLGVETHFVHVTEVRSYYEHGGWFFVSSHVAVGYGQGPNTIVLDLSGEVTNWKLAYYEPIDDSAALALFYNNVAVDAMTAGRYQEAERIFRFFLAREPGVVELYNNLGVLLNRRRRPAEALAILNDGIRRFPRYEPLFTNALRAARDLDRPDLAAWYETRGQEISRDDPYFLFARALSFYEREKFTLAASTFARAADAKPDSPVILAWLARSYLSAGRRREGIEAFSRARRVAPGARILEELIEKYPELSAPAP